MKRMFAVLALAAAACGGEKRSTPDDKGGDKAAGHSAASPAAARPAQVSDADVALADRWVALYGEYAAAMTGAGEDCARAAAAVGAVNRKNAELLATGKPRLAELRRDPAAARWLDDGYQRKLGAELDRMAPALDRCRADPAVSAALAEGPFSRKQEPAAQPR